MFFLRLKGSAHAYTADFCQHNFHMYDCGTAHAYLLGSADAISHSVGIFKIKVIYAGY